MARHPGVTTTNSLPSEEEIIDLAATHDALAAFGIGSVETGHEMAVLAAAVYARGWSYTIDRLGSDFRATVSQSRREIGQFQTVGTGWTMDAALAIALQKALKVPQRREVLAEV